MTRVKNSVVTRARRKKVLKRAEGYFGSKHRLYKTAHEQLMHSDRYAYRDRKQTKRNFRKLWITRINAECRVNDISYSKFIDGLNKAGIEINRKMLSELAIYDKEAFANLVKIAKGEKVAAKPVKKEAVKEEKTDLSSKTVAELKELAKEKNIEGYTSMKKADLIAALK
jgi:ribosomal protein L20